VSRLPGDARRSGRGTDDGERLGTRGGRSGAELAESAEAPAVGGSGLGNAARVQRAGLERTERDAAHDLHRYWLDTDHASVAEPAEAVQSPAVGLPALGDRARVLGTGRDAAKPVPAGDLDGHRGMGGEAVAELAAVTSTPAERTAVDVESARVMASGGESAEAGRARDPFGKAEIDGRVDTKLAPGAPARAEDAGIEIDGACMVLAGGDRGESIEAGTELGRLGRLFDAAGAELAPDAASPAVHPAVLTASAAMTAADADGAHVVERHGQRRRPLREAADRAADTAVRAVAPARGAADQRHARVLIADRDRGRGGRQRHGLGPRSRYVERVTAEAATPAEQRAGPVDATGAVQAGGEGHEMQRFRGRRRLHRIGGAPRTHGEEKRARRGAQEVCSHDGLVPRTAWGGALETGRRLVSGRFRTRRRLCKGLAVAFAAVTAAPPSPLAGQPAVAPRGVSTFLPADHWSADAVRRLHALGLAPRDFDPGVRSRGVAEVWQILETAAARAAGDAARTRLVADYRDAFRRDYAVHERADGAPDLVRVSLGGGYHVDRGRALGGIGFLDGDWTGARALPEARTAAARVEARASWRGHLAIAADASTRNDGSTFDELYVGAGWRILGFWAGRRSPGYGVGAGGALVLSGTVPFTGIGAQLNHGYTLPGVLRVLGPVRLEGFVAEADNMHKEPGSVDERFRPYFGAARISGSPFHSRFTLSASRAAMFGGEGNAPVTLRNLLRMFAGDHAGEAGEFHQEVFAVDATYRPPVGPLPLLLRVEYGMDDAAGMWHRAPAVIWAVELGAVPGLPVAGLVLERTLFTGCFDCRNTLWYRNWYFREGWTHGGRPLGHPLGGHGREYRMSGAFAPIGPLGFDAEVRLRDRRAENLFAPERAGASTLLGARARWRSGPRVFVDATGSHEWGERGWHETRLEVRAGYRF
jgi:hypothetical protein